MLEKFYLGTYTKRKSKGIYSIKLDTTNQKLINLKLEVEIENPTYIDIKKEKIYSVCSKKNSGGIAVINKNKIVYENLEEKKAPCYIKFDNEKILTANYHTGSIIEYKNDLSIYKEVNKNKLKTIKYHAHFSEYIFDDFIITCYLGTDEVVIFKKYNNEYKEYYKYKTEKNSGPRHIVFNKEKSVAYLICELDSTIEVLNFNKKNFSFDKIQKINILKNNEDKKWASAIKLSSCGKYLYASNRRTDVITVFKITEKGYLEKIQTIKTYGKVARDFSFSKNEDFVIVGHQESDNLTLFKKNIDGTLSLISYDTFAPEVVCIKTFN